MLLRKKNYGYLLMLFSFILWNCASPQEQQTQQLTTGMWRAELNLQNQQLPFNFDIMHTPDSGYQAYLINGEERLLLDEISVAGDSVFIPMNFFDTQIRAKIQGEKLEGYWTKNYAEDYTIPFTARHGDAFRFAKTSQEEAGNFDGKWAVYFADGPPDSLVSIGIFNQKNEELSGTFLTTTGDYRYLDGNATGNQMWLSAFDGEHAYLFSATLQEDGTLQGDFWSGQSYHTTWVAHRDESAELPDASQLTFIKKGYDQLDFTFPNLEGEPVSLQADKYQDKVVIVQIFGTWCPNCMDETKFLSNWYNKNQDQKVEIIGLAYERKDDFDYASQRVKKMIDKLDVQYDFLIAGVSDKEKAAETLPMLNQVLSFPTTIFIDKNGKVRRIHTGFSGPGTGVYYEEFVSDFNTLMDELLKEKPNS